MDYTNKTTIEKNKRNRGLATIAFLGCVGCAALVLTVYSMAVGEWLFALAYVVAFLLSAVYTVIKINTVIPSFVACDEEKIYLCGWENNFFPFKTNQGFIGEFIPEKVKTEEIPMTDIKSIFIGTGNFIIRNLPDALFGVTYKQYKEKFSYSLKRMEFIHIVTKGGEEFYMPVTDFDPTELGSIIKAAIHKNPMLSFTTANRKIRRHVPTPETRF